jgi:hypothetical protein
MFNPVIVRFAYFGYSVMFDAAKYRTDHERRLQANRMIIDAYGSAPAMPYVQPGLPFPDYVPCQVWDSETQDFWHNCY